MKKQSSTESVGTDVNAFLNKIDDLISTEVAKAKDREQVEDIMAAMLVGFSIAIARLLAAIAYDNEEAQNLFSEIEQRIRSEMIDLMPIMSKLRNASNVN